jgi:hypothetical protein
MDATERLLKESFICEPKSNQTMEMLLHYKPKSTEELAEWILMAANNLVDQDGKRIFTPLRPFMGYQIARMMQIANLKIPKAVLKEEEDGNQETHS